MDRKTQIARRNIPIVAGDVITLQFSSGRCGEPEAGAWEFWTVFNEQLRSTARCRPRTDPGERFRRMEGLPEYETHWTIAATAKAIRPATQREVIRWLSSHPEDAQFAQSCRVGLKNMRVVRTEDGFRFE